MLALYEQKLAKVRMSKKSNSKTLNTHIMNERKAKDNNDQMVESIEGGNEFIQVQLSKDKADFKIYNQPSSGRQGRAASLTGNNTESGTARNNSNRSGRYNQKLASVSESKEENDI